MKRIQVIVEDWQHEMLQKRFVKTHDVSGFIRRCISEQLFQGREILPAERLDFEAHKVWEKRRGK